MPNMVTTINPANEQPVNEYQLMNLHEANKAVDLANDCYQFWKKTTFTQRAQKLNKLADLIEANSPKLVALMTEEMGKVTEQGKQEVALCAKICRYTAEQGESELQDEHRVFEQGHAIITYQPIGVILGIQPWNFPLYQVIRYSVSNVMAGNTTVMKHASNVFGMAKLIEELYLEAGFPKGCFQSLLIDGKTAGELIENHHIRGVTFTGSDKVGKQVAKRSAELSKKTVLELGSNDAFVVLADADIEKSVAACIQGRIVNNGETCVAAKRFIIVDEIYDQFRDAFVSGFKQLKVGDPSAADTDLGPMARKDLRDELHQQVEASIDAGARCTLGGKIPKDKGFYYPVTILEDVKPGMPAYDDELFGPVASLIRVKDEAEAMMVANDSRYGLGGGIFSKDTQHATELAIKEFDTGMVNINGYSLAQPNLPFGGVKDSGYGREHGGFGIKEFVNVKTVMVANAQ